MSSTRLHPHHSLPAPVVHAAFSVPQSKSHVLAGLQDAYWSDDEAEDAECPLCLEEMDISDLNFKPCICGYQICRFCWHHIKENLNKRCPACRRVYTDDAVEFKPIATQDHKRLTQQKKQRDRERKELESLGRKHLANVRVVQRNVVYIVGIGPRFAKEELIPTLRSNEYFGQYGKITKIILVKRNSPGGGGPVVGLYITYHRREDAARAIGAVDGTASPGGGREIMRASYGTTKYCMAFLRGVQCGDHSCMNLHEWGDEKDCFTKEDLTTLKHTMKATESRTRTITKKADEDAGLPRAASWAQKGPSTPSPAPLSSDSRPPPNTLASVATTIRTARRTQTSRVSRNSNAASASDSKNTPTKTASDRKATSSLSRPSTPAVAESSRPEPVPELPKAAKAKEVPAKAPSSPPPRKATPEETATAVPTKEVVITPSRPESTDSSQQPNVPASSSQPLPSAPAVPPGLGAPPGLMAPPGLSLPPGLAVPSAPPGLSTPNRPPRAETASPQTPLLASQSSYQMSTAARALLDDVKARRESTVAVTSVLSPFPDFDRMLQTLSGEDGGGFSFNLDPKLADEADPAALDFEPAMPFHGTYMDAFPSLRTGSPYMSPSLNFAQAQNYPMYDSPALRSVPREKPVRGNSYLGSFNPFSDTAVEDAPSSTSSPLQRASQYSPVEEERKVSRFGFARGRQSSTAASSPMHNITPLHYINDHQPLFYPPSDEAAQHPWPPGLHDPHGLSNSHQGSPMPQRAQAQTQQQQQMFGQQHQSPLPSLDSNVDMTEAALRNFILSSQDRENNGNNTRNMMGHFRQAQHFEDPAIMSASFASLPSEPQFQSYRPPPGLPVPQRMSPSPAMFHPHQNAIMSGRADSSQVNPVLSSSSSTPPTLLSSEDFPALAPSSSDALPVVQPVVDTPPKTPGTSAISKAQEKAERKAAKKAAAAEKAAERLRIAQEKAEAKALEKARIAKEKQAEKEKADQLKAQQLSLQVESEIRESAASAAVTPTTPSIPSTPVEAPPRIERQKTQDKPAPAPSRKPSLKSIDTAVNKHTTPSGKSATRSGNASKESSAIPEETTQVPLLSKKPKKNKPIKPVKLPREEDVREDVSVPSTTNDSRGNLGTVDSTPMNSRAHSVDRQHVLTSVQELLEQIDTINPGMELPDHPFFDVQRLTSPAKMPLEYGPLVHALSALSVGGGSFANNMPSGSIDNAVSSFQQLLETLTQTISDLLRLLPRTTWDDSSSFDGVLRDMLKGDDFLDDGEEGPGKEDEVAALTLALERRARWMEVQLSKLEELHRDINTAAVRAVLSFNDSGWDRHGFLPKVGNTLRRFDTIGLIEENGTTRAMTADELEKKLVVAKEAAMYAETEIREAMERFQSVKN